MKSKKSHEGYLLIDNTFGPGVPDSIIQEAAKNGKYFAHSGEGQRLESGTITCSHCHTIVILNPERIRARNYCSKCDHYICDNPGCNTGCFTMNQRIDEAQENAFLAEQAAQRGTILTV